MTIGEKKQIIKSSEPEYVFKGFLDSDYFSLTLPDAKKGDCYKYIGNDPIVLADVTIIKNIMLICTKDTNKRKLCSSGQYLDDWKIG